MRQRRRIWFVLSLVAATTAILLLISGLSSLDLDYAGLPLPSPPREDTGEGGSRPTGNVFQPAMRALFMVAGALLPFALIYFLISPDARTRVLRDLIALLIILVPLYLLWRAQPNAFGAIGDIRLAPAPSEDLPAAPDVGPAPEPAQWLIAAATVGIALLGAAGLVAIGWAVWRRRQRPSTPADELAQRAQDAIDAIQAGADLKDTVSRCYFEMMQVLKEERGIRRERAMTPREFEARLEEAGIPAAQVRRLTRLFEKVRYGDKQLGEQEERQAIVSLTAIVRTCRSTA